MVLRGDLERVFRDAAVTLFVELVARDELRGDLAAEVRVVFPRFEVFFEEVPRAGVARRPLSFAFVRADVVRDEEERAPVLDDEPVLFEPPPDEALRLPPDEGLAAFLAVELFLLELPPRLAEPLRPLLGLFLEEADPPRDDLLPEDDLLLVDLLRDEDEPPILPAALFLEDVLLELLPVDLDEPVLFLDPPLLLPVPDDERELDDFLVVAMLITLQFFAWYLPAPATISNTCADLKCV